MNIAQAQEALAKALDQAKGEDGFHKSVIGESKGVAAMILLSAALEKHFSTEPAKPPAGGAPVPAPAPAAGTVPPGDSANVAKAKIYAGLLKSDPLEARQFYQANAKAIWNGAKELDATENRAEQTATGPSLSEQAMAITDPREKSQFITKHYDALFREARDAARKGKE